MGCLQFYSSLTLYYAIGLLAELPERSVGILFSFSYDTWVHAADIDADTEDPPIPEKPWKVRVHSIQNYSVV